LLYLNGYYPYYIDKLYEFLKNLNSALDHDDVELRMCSKSLPENSININMYKEKKMIRLWG